MSDSVNRELVLGYIDYVRVIGIGKKKALEYIRKYVEHLPSDRPNGKWTYAGYDGHVKCDMCAKTYDWFTDAQYFDFCPNCGADMRGEAERSRR
jgi:hypothetical protein